MSTLNTIPFGAGTGKCLSVVATGEYIDLVGTNLQELTGSVGDGTRSAGKGRGEGGRAGRVGRASVGLTAGKVYLCHPSLPSLARTMCSPAPWTCRLTSRS